MLKGCFKVRVGLTFEHAHRFVMSMESGEMREMKVRFGV